MFRSIKTKILILQIGLVISVAVSLGVASYVLTFSSLRDSQKQNLKYLSEYVGEQIKVSIENKEQLLEKIGSSEAVMNYFRKQQGNFLVGYFEQFMPEFDTLSYVNEKGDEELKIINGKLVTKFSNISNSVLFQRAISNSNKTLSSYTSFSPELNGPCIEFGICDKDFFDDFVGFILGKISITQLTKGIRDLGQIRETFAILVDSNGAILACPDEIKISKKLIINGEDSEQIFSEIKNGKAGYGRAMISETDSYFAYAPVNGQKWSVIAVLPYGIFSAKLYTLRNTVVLVGITILIAGITLSIFVASDITRPILKLVETAGLVATGDFSQKVDVNSKDEIGILGNAFNQMAANLLKTTTSITNLNKEITERKKAENAQQRLNEEMEETVHNLMIANRELESFANVAAHDLKAPLRAMGSLAGILMADYGDRLDEQGRQYLDTLLKRAERMSELISGILTYSEIERETVLKPVNMNDIVREVIAGITVPDNIEIVQENDFPTILCAKTHIIQVFQNLLSNAIKFMDKPKGFVRLNCVEDDNFWIFSVSDNGCGIEPKYFDKIFQIFQTLVRRDEEESTGIGLSVVKRIVEKYNGKIWVESRPQIGSTFFFTIQKAKMEVSNEKFQTNTIS